MRIVRSSSTIGDQAPTVGVGPIYEDFEIKLDYRRSSTIIRIKLGYKP